jgi:hypothetical protein
MQVSDRRILDAMLTYAEQNRPEDVPEVRRRILEHELNKPCDRMGDLVSLGIIDVDGTGKASVEVLKHGHPDVLPANLSGAPTGETLESYLTRQWEWSKSTFGPGRRTLGILEHIGKELKEIEAEPTDLSEWIDVVVLAMDGFWRHGGKLADLMPALLAKQRKNFARKWPKPESEDVAVEHIK